MLIYTTYKHANALKGTVVTKKQFADINNKYVDVLARVEKHTKDIASINENEQKNQDFETDLNETKSNVSKLETRANKLETRANKLETRAKNVRLDLEVLHAQTNLRNIKLSELRKAFLDQDDKVTTESLDQDDKVTTELTKLPKLRKKRPFETEAALKL